MESFSKSTKEYLEKTKNIKPRENLVKAIDFCKNKNEALDLGSGALNDSKYLVSIGFKNVTAVDKIDITESEFSIKNENINYIVSTFDNFNFEKDKYDLINAQNSLSFNPKESFQKLLLNIKDSLKEEGIFCGNIFGLKTDFPNKENLSYFTLDEVKNILNIFEILYINEKVGKSVVGNKDMQIFDFICRNKK